MIKCTTKFIQERKMTTDALAIVDKEIETLIYEPEEHSFSRLRDKVEEILKSVDIFLVDNEVDSKAIDLYLKTVINQRNELKRQREKLTIKTDKYSLIESICLKLEFDSQEAVLRKVKELERKSITELLAINRSF